MKKSNILSTFATYSMAAVLVSACSGTSRVLIVKTTPPEADVCIKGKARSPYFSNEKSCVGTTPFEAEKVMASGPDGEKHQVKFSDVEADKDGFYLLVSHKGYISQTVEVPTGGWDHSLTLKSDVAVPAVAVEVPAAQVPTLTPPPPITEVGAVKLVTEPTGAVVSIAGLPKGNTPQTVEAPVGQMKFKIEYDGYESIERAVVVQANKQFSVTIKMVPKGSGKTAEISVTPTSPYKK